MLWIARFIQQFSLNGNNFQFLNKVCAVYHKRNKKRKTEEKKNQG